MLRQLNGSRRPMTLPVGADIESICSKCGDVWHVVVAKVGDKIVKVQCKQCGALHRPKAPQPPPKAARTARAPSRAPATGRGRSASAELPSPAQPDPSRTSQPYKVTTWFNVGDQVQHPTFGLGLVAELPSPGKVQIRFAEGMKLLIHGRAPVD